MDQEKTKINTRDIENKLRSIKLPGRTLKYVRINRDNETKFQKDARNDFKVQKINHRGRLLKYIIGLSICSFVALVALILINVADKIFIPDRGQLISDEVIKFFIVGVFTEILGVVATVARQVWHD